MKRLPPRWRPGSIGQRFAIAIGIGAALVLIALTAAIYGTGRELLLSQTRTEALREVQDEVGNWDDLIDRMTMIPTLIAATELSPGGRKIVTIPWMSSLLQSCPNPAVYGVYVVRDDMDWRDPESDIWVDRRSWPNGARLQYDFHDPQQDWYAGAKKGTGIHITRPYFDEGGSDIEMISVTLPLRNAKGDFVGVAGTDLSLGELRKVIRGMHLRDFGSPLFSHASDDADSTRPSASSTTSAESSYLISPEGNVIIGPETLTRTGKRMVPSPSDPDSRKVLGELAGNGLPLEPAHLRMILEHPSGTLRAGEAGDRVIYWAQSRTTGWKLLLVVPYRKIISPAVRLAWITALIGTAGLLLLITVVFAVSRRISAPILRLQDAASLFEKGEYDAGRNRISEIEGRADELGRFAKGFTVMAGEIRLREERLKNWNESLESTVRERTTELRRANAAMEAELTEAAAYAAAVLPPPLAGTVQTDWIFRPSARLGGDSFGYRWIDPDTLALYLIDVCGHGVGAALLSVSVVGVLASGSLPGTDFLDPAAVLRGLNRAFPMERHNEMYFTAWYGIYRRSSGTLRFSCGGHPPALHFPPGGPARELASSGPVVGAFPEAEFGSGETTVPEGSRLYLFSDGAYEIVRKDGGMMTYGELRDLLGSSLRNGTDARGILGLLERERGGGAFDDDVSLVAFRFGPTTDSTPVVS